MRNTPDTAYFVYLYVLTCEDCNFPYVETVTAANAPRDEIHQQAVGWTCENCNCHQYTAGYRSAVYVKALSVKN